MMLRVYSIKSSKNDFASCWTYEMPDGKLEQFMVAAQN